MKKEQLLLWKPRARQYWAQLALVRLQLEKSHLKSEMLYL